VSGRTALRDPASFRDPDNAILDADGVIYRTLTQRGLANWRAVSAAPFFSAYSDAGKIVATRELDGSESRVQGFEAPGVLSHERIRFLSYPYEWPFGMLKDAALLQMELLRATLAESLVLKDASPYNVQWKGTSPVFIDVGSFEPLDATRPWSAYRQFCMQFLNPLLLTAHKGIDFQPLLRGRLEGVTPQQCRNHMSLRDLCRRGVLTHVWLHSRLERRYSRDDAPVADELAAAGFNRELMFANVKRLERLLRRLDWEPPRSAWTNYDGLESYEPGDAASKREFVEAVVGSQNWKLAWDLGCNDGAFSRLAARSARYVVAMDSDHAVVEGLYRSLKKEENPSILPLVVDIADPSPGLGWRGAERRPLDARAQPTLVLCLALVHHLVLTSNVPFRELTTWLRSLDACVVIEFVSAEDPKARELLMRKRAGLHDDYDRATFERELSSRFAIVRRQDLPSGTRTLYFLRPCS
jgi:hypothetical protein